MNTLGRFEARDLLLALVINLCWGLNIVAAKLTVALVPPFTAALLRQALLATLCLPWLVVVPGHMRRLLALGLLMGGVFFALVNLSLAVTDNVGALAIAGLLGAPFSLVLAVVLLGERIGLPRIAGIALALAGCSLLLFDPAAAREVPGLLLTVLQSMVWAVGSLWQRQLAGVRVLTMYAWIGLGGVVVLGPLALIVEPHAMTGTHPIPPMAFAWIACSAIGSTLIGSGGMAWLLQRHPVSAVVPMTLGAPVIAVIAAALVFGKPLTPVMILGGVIALAGVAIVTMRTARAREGLG